MGLPSTKVCHGASNIFPLRKDQSRVHKENCGKVIRIKNDFFLNPEFWTRLYLRRIKGDARYYLFCLSRLMMLDMIESGTYFSSMVIIVVKVYKVASILVKSL